MPILNRPTTHRIALLRPLLLTLMALASGACSTLATRFPTTPKTPSVAIAPVTDSDLTRQVAARVAANGGKSGFRPLLGGSNALLSRIVLADSARHSIDLQYYIFANDETGRLVAQRLLAAADRGVRVRILLDDLDIDKEDKLLDALDAHPNIEVRLFNPLRIRDRSVVSKIGQFVLEAQRLNRRMHNKSFIVDGVAAVIGGRNIGDAYFNVGDDVHFRDLDVVCIGPVVPRIASMFDRYWNDEAAIPVTAFSGTDANGANVARARQKLDGDAHVYAPEEYAKAEDLLKGVEDPSKADRGIAWFWGDARLVADAPEKVDPAEDDHRQARIERPIQAMLEEAKKQILVISPYFIPGEDVEKVLEDAARRGVEIKALTNSLAANDEPEVHAGYAHYRRPLLVAGAELYEFRPIAGKSPKRAYGRSSGVSLHAKTMVVDHRQVFIGSMNFDPRSRDLNTEMGVIVESEGLADAVEKFFGRATAPENSFHVMLDPASHSPRARRALRWTAADDGREVMYEHEPECSLIKRLRVDLMRVLPIEGLL